MTAADAQGAADRVAEEVNAGIRYAMWSVFALEEVLPEDDGERRSLIAAAERAVAGDAGTASTRAPFVEGLVDLVLERAAAERGENPERVTVGALDAWPDVCRPGCCRMRAGVDSGVPAACGLDLVGADA